MLDLVVHKTQEDVMPVRWKTVLKVWAYYILAFLPGVPQIGKLSEAICLFVQSFGRNMLNDEVLNRVIWGLREAADYDDEAVFRTMFQRDYDPGESNFALARYSMRLADRYRVPVISQWEVVYAIFLTNPAWYRSHKADIDTLWPPREGYFATWHVKKMSRDKMLARGLVGRPLEVAHPAMVARAIPTMWSLGLDPVVEDIKWYRIPNHELWAWDSQSIQSWTRCFPLWLLRETIGRALHVVLCFTPAQIHNRLPEHLRNRLPGRRWLKFKPVAA